MTITIDRNTVLVGTFTAADVVARAYRRMQAIDLNSEPSDAEVSNAIDGLNELINSWAHPLPELAVQVKSGTTINGDATVVFATTEHLADDLNVSGTGIPAGATVDTVTNTTDIELSANATASGTVDITFTPVPFPVRHRRGITAILAAYMCEDLGMPVPPKVQEDADAGWAMLLADYTPDKKTVFDRGLVAAAGVYNPTTNQWEA